MLSTMKADEAMNLLQALGNAIHGHSNELRIKYTLVSNKLYDYNEQYVHKIPNMDVKRKTVPYVRAYTEICFFYNDGVELHEPYAGTGVKCGSFLAQGKVLIQMTHNSPCNIIKKGILAPSAGCIEGIVSGQRSWNIKEIGTFKGVY